MKDISNDPNYVEPDEDGDFAVQPGAPTWKVLVDGEVQVNKSAAWFNAAKHLGTVYEVIEFTPPRPSSS